MRAAVVALALGACAAPPSDAGSVVVLDPGSVPVGDAGSVPVGDAGNVPVDDAGTSAGCPEGMARVGSTGASFCIDAYEAYVVEIAADGGESPHSPVETVDALCDAGNCAIRAKVAAGVFPQAYVSQRQASAACANAGKRLCAADEFVRACSGGGAGPDAGDWYPYGGQSRIAGACNEGKGSAMPRFYGADASKWTYADFNDARLDEWDGGLAATGAFERCVSPDGVHDCVGNLHEWGDDPPDARGHGRFRGGFFGDAELNGHGCRYVTSAHKLDYHDYSTGFRCCADTR